MTNAGSGRGYRKHDDFYYFDQLPQELRAALADAAFSWDAKWFLDRWNAGRYSIPALVRAIRDADANKATKNVPFRKPGNFGWSKHKPAYADKSTRVKPLYRGALS
jgi:hypothetical protein